MNFTDWQETIMCYCAADSFEPEVLKARLWSDPNWNEEFRDVFEATLAKGHFNTDDWARSLNFHFRSEQEVARWLRGVFDFLYFSGPAPDTPT